jgi:chorismate mutase
VLGTDPDVRIRDLQDKVDNIDAAIVSFLAERFRCTGAIGALKAKRALPFRDPEREAAHLSRLRRLAADSKFDPNVAEKFLAFVFCEVTKQQLRQRATNANDNPSPSYGATRT